MEADDGPRMANKRRDSKRKRAEIDAYYFGSYSKASVHKRMLTDTRRMRAYERAIQINESKISEKIVIDVGCGTGILSIMCANMGAKHICDCTFVRCFHDWYTYDQSSLPIDTCSRWRIMELNLHTRYCLIPVVVKLLLVMFVNLQVYAVEASDMADTAREIVEANNLSEKITVVRGRVEDVELDLDEGADVMISEWMGQMLIFEAMLESVIIARDRWLKPGGLMLPTFAELYMAPVSLPRHYEGAIHYWRNVHGVNMSAMIPRSRRIAFEKPVRDLIGRRNVLTTPHVVKQIDCRSVRANEVRNIKSYFSLKVKLNDGPEAMMHGFGFWFKVVFESPRTSLANVELLTGPSKGPTHWKQTVIFLNRPVKVKNDGLITGSVYLKQKKGDHRALDILIGGLVGETSFIKKALLDEITEGTNVFSV